MVVVHSTMSHLLSLDLLSLTINQKDAFYATLALLESTTQVLETIAFIYEAFAQTSSIFSSMDCVVKSIVEIVSKLDALKEKNMDFDHSILTKK